MLETFGCGNFTSTRSDLVLEIQNAVDRGILIINCTQCYSGNIAPNYQTGQVGVSSKSKKIFLKKIEPFMQINNDILW